MRHIKVAKGWKKYYGLLKGLQVKIGTPLFGEKWGIENFIEALKVTEITKEEIELFCERGIKKHVKGGVMDFLKEESRKRDIYLVTTGLDVGPKIISKEYNIELKDYLSNGIIYNNSLVSDCNITITEKNIGNHVKNIVSKYESAVIIDDRPERYNGLDVYDSIGSFKQKQTSL